MTTIVLFDQLSVAPDSPVFEVQTQVTVMAMGMEPGDFISFEIVKVTEGARAKVCGCILSRITNASILGVQELQCPSCEELTQRPVRLTPQNPLVVLDFPQATLLRAIYNGTGLGLQTVRAWAELGTNTQDLTPELRGCPPIFYADEDQTWTDTGAFRCLPDQVTVEYQQVNDCGRYRWFPDPTRPQVWVDTTNFRCLANETDVEVEQTNQCGDRRWQLVVGRVQVWEPTGTHRCTSRGRVELQETNDCGDRRWVDCGSVEWVDTGAFRCLADEVGIEIEQTNQCNHRRWVLDEGRTQVWTPTGEIRCLPDQTTVELEQSNQCGERRWVDAGYAQSWLRTGNKICATDGAAILFEESNQCGERRLVGEPGVVQVWTDTCCVRCLPDQITVELEQSNQCGDRRWEVAPYTQNWVDTGQRRCSEGNYQAQETNQCGQLRWTTLEAITWTDTGLSRCSDELYDVQQVNQCGQLRWVTIGLVTWTATGTTSCVDGIIYRQEANQCGELRLVATAISCGEGAYTATVTVDPTSLLGGAEVCWTIELNTPVIGENLLIETVLSGPEQVANGYTAPSGTITVGNSTLVLCVTTVASAPGTPDRELCLTLVPSVRLPSVPAAVCTIVQNPGGEALTYEVDLSVLPASDTEGSDFVFTVTTNAAVADSDLTVAVALSGTEQADHSYTTPRFVTIPIGSTTGNFTVTTINDGAGGPDKFLTGTIQANARLTDLGLPATATVVATSEPPAASLPASMGAGCVVDNPSSSYSYYGFTFNPDGTLVENEGDSTPSVTNWMPFGQNPANYEVNVTGTPAGVNLAVSGATRGVWLNLATARNFTWSLSGSAPKQSNINATLNIRRVGEVVNDATLAIDEVFISLGVDCP